jgi:hypothetical protein
VVKDIVAVTTDVGVLVAGSELACAVVLMLVAFGLCTGTNGLPWSLR